jgi:integrase
MGFFDWLSKENNGKPYSKDVVRDIKSLLSGAFNDAVDNDICYRNPVTRIKSAAAADKKEKRTYNDGQIEMIINFCRGDPYGVGIWLMLEIGIRSGELRALEWSDIDTKTRCIKINKAAKYDNSIGNTKTGEHRLSPISRDLNLYISNLQKVSKYVIGEKNSLLPVTRDGIRNKHEQFMKRLNRELADKGIVPLPELTPHELRHP